MSEASKTLGQVNLGTIRSVTSSLALACGAMLSDPLVGLTPVQCGQEVALANLSARQAKERGLLTSGTYGRPSTISSRFAALSLFLGSKLQVKTALIGSELFRLTWKMRTMPSGQWIYALRASVRHTSDKDSTSSDRTPWSTPRANKWGFPDAHGSDERPVLGWPTTTSRDWKDGKEQKKVPLNGLLGRVVWLTDSGEKPIGSIAETKESATGSWITPQSKDYRCGQAKRYLEGKHAVSINDQVMLSDSGKTRSGSTAATGSTGQLNPALPRWLQGLPTVWDDCGVMVIRSRRKSRKVSSKAT